MEKKVRLLHIMAGDDMWTPTPEELASVIELFQGLQLDGWSIDDLQKTGVQRLKQDGMIATSHMVQARVIEVDADDPIAGSIWNPCTQAYVPTLIDPALADQRLYALFMQVEALLPLIEASNIDKTDSQFIALKQSLENITILKR